MPRHKRHRDELGTSSSRDPDGARRGLYRKQAIEILHLVHYDYVRPVTAIRFLFAGQPIRAWAGPYQGTRLVPAET